MFVKNEEIYISLLRLLSRTYPNAIRTIPIIKLLRDTIKRKRPHLIWVWVFTHWASFYSLLFSFIFIYIIIIFV